MGFVGGLLGTAGGLNGTGLSGPSSGGGVYNPTNPGMLSSAYDKNTGALIQQQGLVNDLTAQGGLQNQSNVFAQQQALANQLQGVANGTGPNPALAQLNQATGQNIASQAALMAGQRGAGANAGLIARQAAMQGGNIQQQAVGQGAIMQAQQQLAAQQQLGAQQQAMQQVAGSQIGNQIGAVNAYTQGQQGEQQNLLNANASANATAAGLQSNINSTNAGLAGTTMQGQQGLIGGLLGGTSSALMKAHGGMIDGYASGGQVDPSVPQSFAAKFLKGMTTQPQQSSQVPQYMQAMNNGSNAMGQAIGTGLRNLFTPATGTGTGLAGGPMDVGSQQPQAAVATGGIIPGKAEVAGDSYKNDKIPVAASPGEFFIPRSIMSSDDPIGNTVAFMKQELAKKGKSA